MSNNTLRQLIGYSAASVLALPLLLVPANAQDADLSGHSMMSKMKPHEWYPFVAGIVEGIAYHRYTAGGQDTAGMNCVYDWFYKGHNGQRTIDVIYAAFGQYPDHPPAAVVAALAKRKCGG